MAEGFGGTWMRRLGAGRRRGMVVAGLALAVAVAVLPASADTPETGLNPTATLTVTPDDLVSNGQTVTVTGTGFPPNTGGFIRQCGGSVASPQCDLSIAGTFLTTATGDIPPTPVVAKRIVDTGTTTFNCGVQACAMVATAAGVSSQHHISILGAGTLVPTSTSTSSTSSTTSTPSTSTTSTTTSTSTSITVLPPTTTVVPPSVPGSICALIRALLQPFPFLSGLVADVLALLGCGAVG